MSYRNLAIIVLIVAAWIWPNAIHASMYTRTTYICPICETKFDAGEMISFTAQGQRSDLKIEGVSWPPPLSQCPKCHFTVEFTEKTAAVSAERKNVFLALTCTDTWQALTDDAPSYYRYATQKEAMGEDPAWEYLCAVWESGERNSAEWERRSLIDALRSYERRDTRDWGIIVRPEYWENAYLIVELNRRLGRFEAAENQRRIAEADLRHRMQVTPIHGAWFWVGMLLVLLAGGGTIFHYRKAKRTKAMKVATFVMVFALGFVWIAFALNMANRSRMEAAEGVPERILVMLESQKNWIEALDDRPHSLPPS